MVVTGRTCVLEEVRLEPTDTYLGDSVWTSVKVLMHCLDLKGADTGALCARENWWWLIKGTVAVAMPEQAIPFWQCWNIQTMLARSHAVPVQNACPESSTVTIRSVVEALLRVSWVGSTVHGQ